MHNIRGEADLLHPRLLELQLSDTPYLDFKQIPAAHRHHISMAVIPQ